MLDLLHGTVFHTISIKSVKSVFSSAASKLNYFVEHIKSLVLVSAPGRSVNSAIEMTILNCVATTRYTVKYKFSKITVITINTYAKTYIINNFLVTTYFKLNYV